MHHPSHELLAAWADRDPNRPALGCDGNWITFGEWHARVEALAARLAGDHRPAGLLFAPAHGIDFVVAYVACHLAGRPTVALSPSLAEAEREYQLEDAGASVVIDANVIHSRDAPAAAPILDSRGELMADIVYTSGTTGGAKGVLWDHFGLHRSGELIARYIWPGWTGDRAAGPNLGPGHVIVSALPAYSNSSACGAINSALVAGAAVHYLSRFDGAAFSGQMAELGGTHFLGVPSFYALWREGDPDATAGGLCYMTLGAPVRAGLSKWVLDVLQSRARFVNCYGLTESNAALLVAVDEEVAAHPGAIGRPVPGVEARIVNNELLLRGEGMMVGYLNRPEATAAAFTDDGWLRTGDIVSVEHGLICLQARKQEWINRGGNKIQPLEVEELAVRVPGVRDAIALGLPHDVLGEDIALCAEVGDSSTEGLEDAIRAELSEHLAKFKVPRRVLIVEELPRNALGKVSRDEVRHLLAGDGITT